MAKKQINKSSIVKNKYNTPKTEQKKDSSLNGYVFERANLNYGYDLKSELRENVVLILNNTLYRINDQIKKYAFKSIQASKLSKKLKQQVLSNNDVEKYITNLINKDLDIKEDEYKQYYKL